MLSWLFRAYSKQLLAMFFSETSSGISFEQMFRALDVSDRLRLDLHLREHLKFWAFDFTFAFPSCTHVFTFLRF